MLVLTRHVEEKIVLRPTEPAVITIQVQSIRGDKVAIGIDAPHSVRVDRQEVDRLRQYDQVGGRVTRVPLPLASGLVEGAMEDKRLPESDREEIRMFSLFLRLRKDKKPIPPDLRAWLLGEEVGNGT